MIPTDSKNLGLLGFKLRFFITFIAKIENKIINPIPSSDQYLIKKLCGCGAFDSHFF